MKSLHSLTPILSFSQLPDSLCAVHQFFPHLNVGTRKSKSIPDCIQPPPPPIMSMMTEFEISEILDSRLTTNVVLASYCILSVGQGMRHWQRTLDPCFWLGHASKPIADFTLHIQPSLILCQVFDLVHFTSILKSYLKFQLYKSNQFYLLFYSLIVESSTPSSLQAPKPPSRPWAILFKCPFCSLRSSQISSRAKETSCLQPQSFLPPNPLHSDSASESTSTQLFFQGHQSLCFCLIPSFPIGNPNPCDHAYNLQGCATDHSSSVGHPPVAQTQ